MTRARVSWPVRLGAAGSTGIEITRSSSESTDFQPSLHGYNRRFQLDISLNVKYLDIKVSWQRGMGKHKAESLTGGSGVHVFLVLWKALRAVQACAEESVSELEMCGSDFAVLEALLHKGPLPVNEIGKKVLLTSGSITVAVDRLETKRLVERRAHGTDRRTRIVHLTK